MQARSCCQNLRSEQTSGNALFLSISLSVSEIDNFFFIWTVDTHTQLLTVMDLHMDTPVGNSWDYSLAETGTSSWFLSICTSIISWTTKSFTRHHQQARCCLRTSYPVALWCLGLLSPATVGICAFWTEMACLLRGLSCHQHPLQCEWHGSHYPTPDGYTIAVSAVWLSPHLHLMGLQWIAKRTSEEEKRHH